MKGNGSGYSRLRRAPAWVLAAGLGALCTGAGLASGSGPVWAGQASCPPTAADVAGLLYMLHAPLRSVIGHRTLTTQLYPKPGQTEISFDFVLRPQ